MGTSINSMNTHLESKIRRFASPKAPTFGMKLANSKLLPAFHALNRRILNLNLAHPELIEVPGGQLYQFVNAHLESKIRRFCVMKLANSKLLPVFHALNRRILNLNLAHPELIEVP